MTDLSIESVRNDLSELLTLDSRMLEAIGCKRTAGVMKRTLRTVQTGGVLKQDLIGLFVKNLEEDVIAKGFMGELCSGNRQLADFVSESMQRSLYLFFEAFGESKPMDGEAAAKYMAGYDPERVKQIVQGSNDAIEYLKRLYLVSSKMEPSMMIDSLVIGYDKLFDDWYVKVYTILDEFFGVLLENDGNFRTVEEILSVRGLVQGSYGTPVSDVRHIYDAFSKITYEVEQNRVKIPLSDSEPMVMGPNEILFFSTLMVKKAFITSILVTFVDIEMFRRSLGYIKN